MEAPLDPVLVWAASPERELEAGVIALAMAEGCPYGDAGPALMRAELDAVAKPIGDRASEPPAQAIARVILRFQELGFGGDRENYEDPANSRLDQVLGRRKGLPITLSMLFVFVAARSGVAAHGVGFPGHFLVGINESDGDGFFVDPFEQCAVLRKPALRRRLQDLVDRPVTDTMLQAAIAPSSATEIVARMTRNLRLSHLRKRDFEAAIRNARRLCGLFPERAEEHRDLGLLLAANQAYAEAEQSLERYLAMAPDAVDHDRIAARVLALKKRG